MPRTVPLTHAHTGDLVVFNIGMTVRKPWRPDVWGPVFAEMVPMLAELARNRAQADRGEAADLGFFGARTLLGRHGPWVMQYWASEAALHAYAHDADAAHRPAWRRFNQRARQRPDVVGIWHETFLLGDGRIETFYSGGTPVGIGAVTGTVPASRRGATARERLAGRP